MACAMDCGSDGAAGDDDDDDIPLLTLDLGGEKGCRPAEAAVQAPFAIIAACMLASQAALPASEGGGTRGLQCLKFPHPAPASGLAAAIDVSI